MALPVYGSANTGNVYFSDAVDAMVYLFGWQ